MYPKSLKSELEAVWMCTDFARLDTLSFMSSRAFEDPVGMLFGYAALTSGLQVGETPCGDLDMVQFGLNQRITLLGRRGVAG